MQTCLFECYGRTVVPAVGLEPSVPLKTRKLFIPRSDKTEKNDRNAEVRYTAGTRHGLSSKPDSTRARMQQSSRVLPTGATSRALIFLRRR